MTAMYQPRLLDIDLSSGEVLISRPDALYAREYIGGSGINTRLLYDLTGPDTNPLDADNVLLLSVGPLCGTAVPCSGRHHVTAKSPLTGIFGEADVGGNFGNSLRRCGFEGMIVRGQSARPVFVVIEDAMYLDDGAARLAVHIEDASMLINRDAISAAETIRATHGPDLEIAVIGQAGERMVRISSIMHDGKSSRAAGRCGLGAVMGSKRLKAIAVRKTDNRVFIADPEGLRSSVRMEAGRLLRNAAGLSRFGTAGSMVAIEAIGDLPIRNWRDGEFKSGAQRLSGVTMAETILTGRFGCASCPIRCGREVALQDSKYQMPESAGPEYETLASLGSMLLVDDLEAVSYAGCLCNAYGIDTISTGGVIAFAIEAFERGYLVERDFDGYRPQWGSAETLIHLVKLIGLRQGIGAVLGDGVRIAARTFGIPDDADFVIHVKGLELPMHDPRAYNSLAVAYATSNRGACHLQGFTHPFERGLGLLEFGYDKPLDRYAVQGKGRFTVTLQNLMCIFDSLKVCKFLLTSGLPLHAMAEWTSRAAGWDVDLDELMLTGERIFNLKRMYNVENGINRKDDTLPIRILSHKRGSGGSAESLPRLEPMLNEYYQTRGWDENGVPGQRTLRKLGLDAAQ